MNYLRIDKEDICNGGGLRVVLWLSGCSHKCEGCQNPQTWDANSGILFDESAKEELFRELDKDYISGLTLTGGDPLFEGNLADVLDLVTEVNKRYNKAQYIGENAQENHDMLNVNADKIRLSNPQKSIWLYTGFTLEDIMNGIAYDEYGSSFFLEDDKKKFEVVSQCDVLIDGQFVESQRDITLKWRGSKNQRVIYIQKSLQKGEIVLWED